MAHQYMPKIFHGPHKNPPAPPPTYLMYGPLNVSNSLNPFMASGNKRSYILKVGPSPSKKNGFICFNESPFKIMKNAFYFILKAFLARKIFKFLC